jgi:hypothetical protein
MDRIQEELDRIALALHETQPSNIYCQLYSAQQALAWAQEPAQARSPYETITEGLVQPIISDTREAPEDYSDECHPVQS